MNEFQREHERLKKKYNENVLINNAYELIISKYVNKGIKTPIDIMFNNFTQGKMTKSFYPGMIYILRYEVYKEEIIKINGKPIKFTDEAPCVLVMNVENNIISGINLNYVIRDARVSLLNDVVNLAPDWFFSVHKEPDLPKSLAQMQSPAIVKKFVENAHIAKPDNIYRFYASKGIKDSWFIEPWMWNYLPWLNYNIKFMSIISALQKYNMILEIS